MTGVQTCALPICMEVVNRIAETATDYEDRPLEDQVMQTVTVDTFGVDYPEPEKL